VNAKVKSKVPVFHTIASADVEVDVNIQPGELHDAGWHHKSECSGRSATSLGAAVASLHRQAHPGQSGDVWLCHEEPCRSLTIEQLREVAEP
jgi:hypothetical protein